MLPNNGAARRCPTLPKGTSQYLKSPLWWVVPIFYKTKIGFIGGGIFHQQWPASPRHSRENTNK
jgi:hypothetical protein